MKINTKSILDNRIEIIDIFGLVLKFPNNLVPHEYQHGLLHYALKILTHFTKMEGYGHPIRIYTKTIDDNKPLTVVEILHGEVYVMELIDKGANLTDEILDTSVRLESKVMQHLSDVVLNDDEVNDYTEKDL